MGGFWHEYQLPCQKAKVIITHWRNIPKAVFFPREVSAVLSERREQHYSRERNASYTKKTTPCSLTLKKERIGSSRLNIFRLSKQKEKRIEPEEKRIGEMMQHCCRGEGNLPLSSGKSTHLARETFKILFCHTLLLSPSQTHDEIDLEKKEFESWLHEKEREGEIWH